MPITYHKGDLFESGADILVNPVNCVGVMGTGLALQFKKRFPRMFRDYKELCASRALTLSNVSLVSDSSKSGPVKIFLFPTKGHWRDSSSLDRIEDSLMVLRYHLRSRHNRGYSIAIPQIGCGLGGLKWTEVRPLIEKHLGNLSNNVLVYGPAPAVKG